MHEPNASKVVELGNGSDVDEEEFLAKLEQHISVLA